MIDYDNTCGFGPRAIIQMAFDRRKSLLVSKSIEDFLECHVKRLKQNWYLNSRHQVEAFAMEPTNEGAFGSVTVTNGIKISAHAIYNHLISGFDSVQN